MNADHQGKFEGAMNSLKHYNSYSNLYVIITLRKLSNVQEHELKDNSNGEKLLIYKFQMKFYLMI